VNEVAAVEVEATGGGAIVLSSSELDDMA